jgi:hypothetical protein
MYIKNNFVENDLFIELSNYLFALSTPWYRKTSTTDIGKKDISWFSHHFYGEGIPKSDAYQLMGPILQKLGCRAPIQIRANLVLKTKEHKVTNWHADYKYNDSFTSILYINKCNGATVFKSDGVKVISESNKILTFNAPKEHATLTQTDEEERIVVNFNYF